MFIKDCSKQYRYKYSPCKLLVKSYRDEKGVSRHRTILNLSKLPQKLADIIEQSVTGNILVSLTDITIDDSRSLGGIAVLKRLTDRLEITKILEDHLGGHNAKLTLAMVINRIICPKSRYSLRDWLGTTHLPEILNLSLSDFHHNPLYEALKILDKKQTLIENDLWQETKKRSQGKEDEVTLMLYDITSTYLEGLENELAAFGYNRDKKRGKKQLVVGLVTAKDGTPVTIEVLPGNTQDKSTLIPKVAELRRRFGIKEVVYVFDRGMRDQEKLSLLRSKDIRYITALTRTDMKELLEKNRDQNIQLGLFDERGIAEYEIIDFEDKGGRPRRYIICKSDQKDRNRRKREILLQKTEEKLEMIKRNVKAGRKKDPVKIAAWAEGWLLKWKMKKYFEVAIKEGYFDYQRKDNFIEESEVLDGIYILETNTDKGTLSSEEVQVGYKNLSKVEQDFRIIKSILDIRPVNHRKAVTTRGHVFVCFLALYLKRELETLLQPLLKEYTFSHLLTQLGEIRQSRLEAGEHQATILNKLNGIQKLILATLKMRITPIPLQPPT